LQQENYSLEKQLVTAQGPNSLNPGQQVPRKSFENPSASSSTASSGVGTSISSLNATNANLANLNNNNNNNSPNVAGAGAGGASTPSVVKKYMEQKYGNNSTGPAPAMMGNGGAPGQNQDNKNTTPRATSGLFNQAFGQTTSLLGGLTNNINNVNNPNSNDPNASQSSGLSSLTSSLTSGIANLKLSASNFQSNKFSSFLNNPFS
jgi:hypothetical protein